LSILDIMKGNFHGHAFYSHTNDKLYLYDSIAQQLVSIDNSQMQSISNLE